MKTSHRYATATAFRIALEARLKSLAQAEGSDLQRLRRQVSFDRLLARLFSESNAPWLLKGGYAMELRLRSARTTKDIDLSLPGEVGRKGDVLERLQDRAATDMGDYFTFAIGLPQMDLDGAPEGGVLKPADFEDGGDDKPDENVDNAREPARKKDKESRVADQLVLPPLSDADNNARLTALEHLDAVMTFLKGKVMPRLSKAQKDELGKDIGKVNRLASEAEISVVAS
jgi:hypothetical protein